MISPYHIARICKANSYKFQHHASGRGVKWVGGPGKCTRPKKLHQKCKEGKMARYDYQLKIKAVEQYTKSTTTLKQLAKKYKVKDPKTIKEWVDKYNKFGEDGLKEQKTSAFYPTEIKQKVIQLKLTTSLTNREIINVNIKMYIFG